MKYLSIVSNSQEGTFYSLKSLPLNVIIDIGGNLLAIQRSSWLISLFPPHNNEINTGDALSAVLLVSQCQETASEGGAF